MRIEKGARSISSIDDWRTLAGPKRPYQWAEGRSAFELARAWIGSGIPSMPLDVRRILDSRDETRGIVVELVKPEHHIHFDTKAGEPRNSDLAFVGHANGRSVAVTVEAKADEPFGATVTKTMADALERAVTNERSRGLERVRGLARELFGPRSKGDPALGNLRYQLLTAVLATLAYAAQEHADVAVLLVHEFLTDKTSAAKVQKNSEDLDRFMVRLSGGAYTAAGDGLNGPIPVRGAPTAVPLFIGKLSTTLAP